jgi:hypothetical protein
MIKRFFLALALAAGLLSPANSAGTIAYSLSQQFDNLGKPLVGGKLYFIQAGTVSTPQNAFQDAGLTLPLPNPITLDAAGRVPQFFLADGSIKIRLTDKNNVQQVVADGVLVIGPSGGGGGGSPVDPTTIASTGDIKTAYGTSPLVGWVRLNGRTIGSSTSGATERANADVQALFSYLWGVDASLAVSGGRGASAAADWAANKTIALPSAQSRALAGLGDMGNTDNGLFAGATFTAGNSTTLGSRLGAARRTLIRTDLPNVAPTATFTGIQQTWSTNQTNVDFGSGDASGPTGGRGVGAQGQATVTITPAGSVAVESLSGGVAQTAFDAVSPFLLVTIYIKL